MLVWATCWSYMTRLLKTPCAGPWPAIVDSSWIDMLPRAVEEIDLQRPARLLRECAAACRHAAEQYPGQRERSREQIHWRPSPVFCGPARPSPQDTRQSEKRPMTLLGEPIDRRGSAALLFLAVEGALVLAA